MQLLCRDEPDLLEWECEILDARPGAVLLPGSPVFPGGGGQLPDVATLHWAGGAAAIVGLASDPRGWWHRLAEDVVPTGRVRISIDPGLRRLMRELHTLAHVTNAIVFRAFGGARLTGAQLSADATFRVDFDLPGIDPVRLRGLADPINEVIAADLPIRAFHMPWDEAARVPGLFRSENVSPPRQDDGNVRIVEIGDLDRQGCGGTHLASTGEARRVRILKVDNKGRHNRRVKVGLEA